MHLYENLIAYSETDSYPYHMPGHKRRLHGNLPPEMMKLDITEIDGFDNLHEPKDLLKLLQARAAALYSAKSSYFLVNGSTCGILSAVSAALPEGGHILMARNCHKSAYHAVYLRHLAVTYLYPPMLPGFEICDAITPQQIQQALQQEPDIQAVLIVSPTYEGRIANVAAIADIVHAKGIPLLVDEAHGAHLGLAEGFADNSNQAGADIVIHSVHKTLPALTQSAILHCNSDRVNRERLERFLHIYQSSSPSYLLMASIDNALHVVEEKGKELFHAFQTNYIHMLKELTACKSFRFVTGTSSKQDIGKLVIDCRYAGISGKQLYDILREDYHLQLEMACADYCLAMFTIGDDTTAYERMVRALLEIDSKRTLTQLQPKGNEFFPGTGQMPEKNSPFALPLAKAWDMPWEELPLQQAIGYRVADFVNLYPPGVPVLLPGEVLTEDIYHQLVSCLEQGLQVQGITKENERYTLKCIKGNHIQGR